MSYRNCLNAWALAAGLTLIAFGPAAAGETVGSSHETDTGTSTTGSEVLYTNHDLQRAYRLFELTAPRLYDARRARITTDDLVLFRANYQDAQAHIDALAEQWDDLMEDARTSAALPGWFR